VGTAYYVPVSVSRRIEAPAVEIFNILTDPTMHPDIDGSGMLRESASLLRVAGVGDVFVMKMHNEEFGDYEMKNLVVAYEENRRIGWAPALLREHEEAITDLPVEKPAAITWTFQLTPDGPHATEVTEIYDCSNASEELRRAVKNGERWVESMTKTLQRLDEFCAGTAS
jgi:uncharacterized protein YndB with AHSA1/START domain